ncbi:protein HOMOLOG OF MAMMALIAN LYST-INTERACTING PROTEIN 5 [Cynara cardunculus var. scolymus]|uniref:Sorting-associate protein Vta1/Callose synthase n=1 Tax=Cynara cardunculus var. scolymus TaxID=59895 RepID=A0A103Y4B8_CYNCS|nr:protein HOMOLOG OF MAMMALIAN LYST-INTERACTING PROTEIN 5 [Cynara cardunculus var. scolymus]KVI02288.1 sorting-associate protein Vta1/Callose synthase [Cynara cardunculus var. scolymus]
MANENEPAKLLLPYLQRADELQKHEPLVAYYCRLYAMERGLRIPQSERTKTTSSLLVSLMKQLEKDKKSLQLGPDDHFHLEGFASNVFAKADKQDRAGRADLNTAKTFYAASIFFEILNQFGDVPLDLEQKQKYAAWKAADIRKAIKEGRKPVPGPPGGDKDLSDTSSGGYDMEPSRSDSTTGYAPESRPSSQSYDRSDSQKFTNTFSSAPPDIPPPPHSTIPPPHSTMPPPSSNIPPSPSNLPPPSSNTHPPPPSNFTPSSSLPPPPTYSSDDYPSNHFQQHPSPNMGDHPNYSQTYHHPSSFPLEPQHHLPQNYPSHDASYTYPNFQSYPSFSETTIPAAPAHYPSSYYQGSETPYSPPATRPSDHPSTAQYKPSGANGPISEPAPAAAQSYQYDSNYQPTPEKIAEAHKAARFAVGALAFDDVFVAVDYLKKSLELLTNPSASV